MSAPSGRYEALGRVLARAQDERRDSAATRAAVRARLSSAAIEPPPRQRAWLLATGSLALVAAMLVLLWWPRSRALTFELEPDGDAGVAGAWLAAPADEHRTLRFSDGSSIELHANARARVARLQASGAEIVLETGGADVHIESGADAAWLVDAGPYRIRVTGTRFFVGWDPAREAFELELHEGAVVVEGPHLDGTRSVAAGQLLRVASPIESAAVAGDPSRASPSPVVAPVAVPSEPPAVDASPVDRTVAPVRRPAKPSEPPSSEESPTWQELARGGNYRDAIAAAETTGIDALCETLTSAELLRLADVARFARRPKHAIAALTAVRRRFPDTDAAATAAFERGRIALANSRAGAEAASWFETYLHERPDGALAREAMGRLLEALQSTGGRAEAQATARRYLERYPAGPHADLARSLLDDAG